MIVQYCSDLHLEFRQNREWIAKNPIIPKGDILIIAGDTFHLNKNYSELAFIQQASKGFEKVFLIPGNHEYYGGFDASSALLPSYITILENVFMVNNKVILLEDIEFIFSTMWSLILTNASVIQKFMSDFHLIKYQDDKITTNQFNELHQTAFEFLQKAMTSNNKKIVTTHHLPSHKCNSPEFQGSPLNEAFCVDLTKFIQDHKIDYWIYGHSHRNVGDFKIGHTTMLTNQLGYVSHNEHVHFRQQQTFEI